MSWDERLFGWAYARAKRWSAPKIAPELLARQAMLEPLRDRLRVLACALAEAPIEIQEAEREGGFAGRRIFLPAAMHFAPSREANEDAYVLRVAWSVAAMRAGLTFASEDPLERWLATVLAARATRARLLELCPGARERLMMLEHTLRTPARDTLSVLVGQRLGANEPQVVGSWLSAAIGCEPSDARSLASFVRTLLPRLHALRAAPREVPPLWGWIGAPATSEAAIGGGVDAEALPNGTELRARPRERVRRVSLPDDPIDESPLVHSFEKVHTAEEHRGGNKTKSGDDELAEHASALDELDLREVLRTTERASSLLRCDAMIEGAAGDLMDDDEPPGDGIPYDEWNERERSYRAEWCRVRVGEVRSRVTDQDARAFAASIRGRTSRHVDAVRSEMARIELARRWRGRQLDGPEIDEAAVVDRLGLLAAGHSGSERLYRSRRRSAPGLCALLLIDTSLSTDSWIADRRVLDVELEAAHVIAEALDGLAIDLAIATFHSHTRRDCRFIVVKDTDEPWQTAALRFASIRPTGYTRVGPAIRHATRMLSRSDARRRLLLVLTDGKPNDYDRYEGLYGIADVRQAVREAARDRIHVHALAIDPAARFHLPTMFGAYSVVPRPDDLALALGRVCAELER